VAIRINTRANTYNAGCFYKSVEYEQQEQYKERIKEIIHTINERQGLLEQFDDDI
jgi:hypothetical protein